ncbi:MAG: hypothetical protein M5U26_25060 [Planctomycetota bacterium]|nr:hypothetical protein [Planctomycetota bacterium]
MYALLSAAPVVQGQTAGTEMFLLAPLALSLWLTARGVRSSGRSRRASLILAGICGAAACWIKQPAVLPLLLAPLAIVVHHGRLVARTRNDLGWWLAGGLGLSALVLGYFAWQVGLRTFYFWSFATKLNYYGGKTEWYYFFSKFKEGVPDHALPVLLGLAGTALLIYWRHPRAWALPVFVVLSVPATWQGPYFYYHYFALLTPALALLGGAGLSALQAVRFVDRGAAGRTAFACAAGGLLLVCALAAPMRQEDRISPWTHGGHEAAAEWLKAHAEPGAYALPLFTRSQILAMAELRLPHRYPAFYTIHNDFERSAQYQLEMIADIKRHAPRFLLYAPNLDGEFRAPGDQSTAFADYADHLRAEVFAPAAYVVRARGESSRRREAYEALTPEAYEEDPEAYEVVYAILERRKDREP